MTRRSALTHARVNELCLVLAHGGGRAACLRKAAELGWGCCPRTTETYLKLAREKIQRDWDMERHQLVAEMLSQLTTIQLLARAQGNHGAALAAINMAAKITQLI